VTDSSNDDIKKIFQMRKDFKKGDERLRLECLKKLQSCKEEDERKNEKGTKDS